MRPLSKRGVTLIELLVAISLMGMISLALLFSMRIGSGAWRRGNARMAANRGVIAAGDLISAQLADVQARRVKWGPDDSPTFFAYFDGAPERLRLLTSYSLALRSRGGVWLAEYFFVKEGDGCALRYYERQYDTDRDIASTVRGAGFDPFANRMSVLFNSDPPASSGRTLYTGLRDCRFEYLIEPQDAPAYWGKYWITNDRYLPRSVAVRVEGPEQGGIAPVATVATLHLNEVLQP